MQHFSVVLFLLLHFLQICYGYPTFVISANQKKGDFWTRNIDYMYEEMFVHPLYHN